jgi:hypothetical protein
MAREAISCQAGTLFFNARRSKDLEWNVGEKVRMGNDLGWRIHQKRKGTHQECLFSIEQIDGK